MCDKYSYKNPVSIEDAKQILEDYRKTLPKRHNKFVTIMLKKEYNTVTQSVTIGEQIFTGTFREDKNRKKNREAYQKERKIAIVFSSKGFDIILLKETEEKTDLNKNNKITIRNKTRSDAIVNGIVMDFKEITGTSKNTLGNNYQDAMRKKHSQGALLFLVRNMTENGAFAQLAGKTRSKNNGIVLIYHENTDSLQIINMKNLRAAHRAARIGIAPGLATEPHLEPGSKS